MPFLHATLVLPANLPQPATRPLPLPGTVRLGRARLGVVPALLFLVATSSACQTTLSSRLTGSSSPETAVCSPGERVEIQNGAFTIVQTCLDSRNDIVGDGILEGTLWEFDLSEADVAACYPETAVVSMRLRPTGELLEERLRVQGRWAMGLEEIQSLEVGKEQTLVFDMMIRNGRPSPYTPGVLRDLLVEQGGRLPMSYELNALVSSAELTLRCRK